MVFFKKFILVIFSVLFTIIFLEVILRFTPIYSNLINNKLVISPTIFEKAPNSNYLNLHPDLEKVVEVNYDENGFREYKTEKKNITYGFFGDSVLENINIEDDFEFTNNLNIFFENVNFINYGLGGFAIDQIFIRYNLNSKKNHKKIFYFFCSNDLVGLIKQNLITFKNEKIFINEPKVNSLVIFVGKLKLTYLIIDSLYSIRSLIYSYHTKINKDSYSKKFLEKGYYFFEKSGFVDDDNKILFNKILREFKKKTEENNSQFYIVVYPLKYENDIFNNVIEDENNYNIINLYKLNNLNDAETFKSDPHFNEYGNLKIFELLSKYFISEFGLVSKENNSYYKNVKNKINDYYGVN